MNKSRFIYGSIIMVFMNFFVRIIGFTYEVLLSKYLGAKAVGLFQISLSILMIFLILINSGNSISITKLVAEQNSRNNRLNVEKLFQTSLKLNLSIAVILSLIIYLFSDIISMQIPITIPNEVKKEVFLTKILIMSLPLTISGFLSAILNFLNTILISNRLMVVGLSSSEAVSSMGRIMGMTMPLIGLPFIVTNALVVNLIPSLTEQIVLNKYKDIRNDIQLSLKVTLLVSIPLAAVYIVLSKSLAHFLYNDLLVAKYIQIMGVSTILIALQHNFSGILYGINKQVIATITRLMGMIIQVTFIYILVGNSNFGINGVFISYYCSLILIMALDIKTLKKSVKFTLNYVDVICKPIIASFFMVLIIYISNYDLGNLQKTNGFLFALSLFIGALSYILVLFLTKAVPKGFFKKLASRK